jgi:predicted methyltransferase
MKISSKMHFIICGFLSLFFKSRTIKHILRLKASEKKEFLRKMINENIRQDVNEKKIYFSVQKQSFKFVESYNQLPCTVDTRKKRADLLEKNGFCDKHILLMGDDDLKNIDPRFSVSCHFFSC